MTGYGRGTSALGLHTVTLQISSVNRRTLDLSVRLPDSWATLESEIAERIRTVARRGKIQVQVELTGKPGSEELAWDEAAIEATLDRLADFARARDIDFVPTADLLWRIALAQRTDLAVPPLEEAEPVVSRALDEALREFSAMRAKEGEALLVDLLARVEALHHHVARIAERAPTVPGAYREVLFKRLRESGLELDPADERVLKEIALFADRCDISEELTRLRSHLEQLTGLLKSDGEIGRKVEFLLLELGRETHTIGSKANDLAISRSVLELKNELERVKEQIANVE